MTRFRAAMLLAAPLALALATPAQQILVVDDDGGPGVDYLSVAAALAASDEGATILVRAGEYEEFLNIDALSVSILVQPGTTMDGSIEVHDLRLGQSVVLCGIDMQNVGPLSEVLVAEDNLGSVVLERCTFRGSPVSFHTGPDTVILRDCARVVLDRCTIVGGTDVLPESGGRAVLSLRSNLFLASTRLTGGRGTGGNPGYPGGAALTLQDGTLFAFATRFVGGEGGPGQLFLACADGGDGGAGLHLDGTNPRAHLIGCWLQGGAGGTPIGVGACSSGMPGPAHLVEAGELRDRGLPGQAR